MEAKKKARELVDKFYKYCNNSKVRDEYAKQCALIAVDEILENIEVTKLYHKDSKALPFNEQYWQKVKEEIKTL